METHRETNIYTYISYTLGKDQTISRNKMTIEHTMANVSLWLFSI